ncbi:MAG: RHS repeat domain-containing protein [Terriglobia bacterium]
MTQSSQTRVFAYDSLGRLLSATNPESGTTTYTYDANGNMISRTRPTANQTNPSDTTSTAYYYDTLNRLRSKVYSDPTPTATYFYDEPSVTLGSWSSGTLKNTLGRLTHTITGPSSAPLTATVEDYDLMGRPADFWQCTPYDCPSSSLAPSQYKYDLAGDLTDYLTPSNGDCHITTTYNAAERVTQVNSCTVDEYHPAILGQFTYTPWGAISTLTDGCTGTGCSGYIETYTYNNRLQPAMIQLGTASNLSSLSCEVYYYYSVPLPKV